MKKLLLPAFMCAAVVAFGMSAEAQGTQHVIFQKINTGGVSFPAASLLSGRVADGIPVSDDNKITIEPLVPSEQYDENETVRVRIQFIKEAVDASSLDALLEKISEEALDGETLDVHRKINEYMISANLVFGKTDAVRAVEGVESVEVEKRYDPTDTEESSLPADTASEPEESLPETVQDPADETDDPITEEASAEQSKPQDQIGTKAQEESEAQTGAEEQSTVNGSGESSAETAGQKAESVRSFKFAGIAAVICCAAAAAAGYIFFKSKRKR